MKTIALLNIVFLMSCSTFNKVEPVDILLSKLEGLNFTFNSEQTKKIMGEPSEKFQQQGDEIWIYRDSKRLQTMTLRFDGKNGFLRKKILLLNETDRMAKRENALEYFKTIKFDVVEPPWINPHAGPDELYYVSNKDGIRLIFSTSHELFESISWWDVKNPPAPRPKSKVPYKL